MVKTSLVDYPGKVSAAYFLRGCNLRCPYCYNKSLVIGNGGGAQDDTAVDAAGVIAHLKKRKNVLSGFVLSGGEPLLSPGAAELISAARGLGYFIKLDTNGTFPEILARFLENTQTRPDYIALDVKTSPSRYHELAGIAPAGGLQNEIIRSIEIVSALPASMREFRTVLVPGLVTENDVRNIAGLLPKDAAWFFSPFKPGGCVDPSFDEFSPYTDAETDRLVATARGVIHGARLR
ncbi:MAG: anaerobic ribonucleoside-triphosphate reductase activating protein [Treponemataceae bacterium]|nr:MAG: anaerobic ribonucleoside-triphosphate reductase activating protein [Treponemataceae bacterium]